MRVGIFIQGQLRRSEEELLSSLRLLEDAFPNAEFCYSLWNTEYENRKEFCDKYLTGNLELFEEFDIGYEPYLDNPGAIQDYQYLKKYNKPNPSRHRHQTKQILLHNELLKKYGHRYDVIVRTRWDSTISPTVDFTSILKECYDTPATISCMGRSTISPYMMNIIERADWKEPYYTFKGGDGKFFVADVSSHCMFSDSGIIIHRVDDWDCDLVDRLHNTKKLLAAEFGWHQILVQGTKHHQWIHYDGGAMLTRCITKEEKVKIKQMVDLI
jgi:hypothetical protein